MMSSQPSQTQPEAPSRASWHTHPLRAALALTPLLVAGAWALLRGPSAALAVLVLAAAAQLSLLIVASVRVAAPWERAVVVRNGRPVAVRGPGIYAMLPLVEEPLLCDLRLRALGLQRRRVLTADGKAVWVESALFYQMHDPLRALSVCRELDDALAQVAHAALRAVIARAELAALEKQPEKVEADLEEEMARLTDGWGVHVDRFRLLAAEPVYLVNTQRTRALQEYIAGPPAGEADPPPAMGRDGRRADDKLAD
jgi:regulator of protease activity HflC (stomatin/prohibitin superfamily)